MSVVLYRCVLLSLVQISYGWMDERTNKQTNKHSSYNEVDLYPAYYTALPKSYCSYVMMVCNICK